jgi:arsenite methyltransferase
MTITVSKKANYGIDAPPVIRNLVIAGVVYIATVLILKPLTLTQPVISTIVIIPGFILGWFLLLSVLLMVWSSKVGKFILPEQLIDSLALHGDEALLDVGCGRGLFLNVAARRLTKGKATGIDIWQSQDQSGNRPEVTLANEQAEGVAKRVEIKTGDMRELPFPDETMDVIISSIALHNIYEKEGQERAVREIARVVRASGKIAIVDF